MYNIIGRRRFFYFISLAIIVLGLISLAVRGLNLGIDFTSGTLFQVQFDESRTASEIENLLMSDEGKDLGIEKASVRMSSGNTVALIRVNSIDPKSQTGLIDLLETKFGNVQELSVDKVDPIIGQELIRKALIAVLLASIGILAYISVRFEPRSAVAGVIALIHDVMIVISIFSITQVEINSPFVAAILTVVGYSINDTIVIFDRIRENMGRVKIKDFEELVNLSLNQTLVRSLNTSLTTFFVVLALFIFGASSIRDLTLAFLIGVIVGTYSSIFIASAIWVDWKEWDKKKALAVK